MFSKELKKIISLIKKTGDKVILFNDNKPDESVVLMDLSAYENMHDIETETSKKSSENSEEKITEDSEKTDIDSKKVELTEEDITDRINREISLWKNQENPSFVAGDQKPEKNAKPWQIPSKVKQNAKEVK